MPPVPVAVPPAIHAPVPAQQVTNAASMQTLPARSVQRLQASTAFTPINDLQGGWLHFRWQHTKRWKGKPQRSQEKRANGRKASKRAKNRRKRS